MTEYDGPDPDDVSTNPTEGPIFSEVVQSRAGRRTVLAGGLAGAATFLTAAGLGGLPAAAARPGGPKAVRDLLGFEPIPLGLGEDVQVPAGYTARTFIPWGTPITGSYPDFAPGANTAEEQAQQAGMNHDGMHFFPLSRRSSDHGVMVVNHEYTNEQYLHSVDATPAERVAKSQAAHGLSVIEVKEDAPGEWTVVRSRLNRRITANTPMSVSGPAAGHPLLQTSADPDGRTVLGTWNNCSSGATPWGTYLAAEENFHSYFAVSDGDYGDQTAQMERYGVGGDRFGWATADDRFVVTPEAPNEPNRFGWIVELDPMDPNSRPTKRTALGRVKHEGATVHVTKGGRVAVYCGDDQRGEHVYKFVSNDNWKSARARGRSPLDEGTLYVARFNDDGSGDWLPLVHGQGGLTAENGFADQAEVLVKTRLAASVVGATKMDRPEWITVDPHTQMVYCTLTNNTDPSTREPNAANPRENNPWGHVIRWQESRNDHTATTFSWDLFLLAGQGDDSGDGSTIDAADAFGSPDGIASDPDGRVWIQTDGSQPEGATNQMLVANPYVTDSEGRPEIRRFLTGPAGCEVTGLTLTPDQRTMFINIQHPGGVWPAEAGIDVPRSATVVITKDDGGVIGSSDDGHGHGGPGGHPGRGRGRGRDRGRGRGGRGRGRR